MPPLPGDKTTKSDHNAAWPTRLRPLPGMTAIQQISEERAIYAFLPTGIRLCFVKSFGQLVVMSTGGTQVPSTW